MINREVIYERNMTGSYMKIPVGINAGLDEKLMLKRKLQGTLPVEKTYVDGTGQYWYNISGKQSLDTYCRVKQIGIGFVEKLVVSICSELDVMEWNLIHTGCLMLDPELIFITNANQEFIFTLYPGSNTRIEAEFQQLMEYMLTKIDHKDEAAVRAAYGIYEKTLEESYSIMDIRETIMRAKQQEIAEAAERRHELEGRGSGRERVARQSTEMREGREAERKRGIWQSADAGERGRVSQKHGVWQSAGEGRDAERKGRILQSADVREGRGTERKRGIWQSADVREVDWNSGHDADERRENRKKGKRQKERETRHKWKSGNAGADSDKYRADTERDRKESSLHGLLGYVKKQLGFADEQSATADTGFKGTITEKTTTRAVGKNTLERERDSCLIYPEEEIYEPQEEIHPTVCLSSYAGNPRGILVYQGVEQLADIPLESHVTRIGYGKEADARIEQDTVSQMHARIDRDGGDYYIEDLNSTNGTYVNDELLAYKERRQLRVNDIVCFADLRYRFC